MAIDGEITPVQADKIRICKQHISFLEALADSLSQPFSGAVKIVESTPGSSHLSALIILSEIGDDMSKFNSVKHLCSWAGLAPCNNQSAGKKKSTKISRAGIYIKPIMLQCALAALKDNKFPYYKQRYESLKRRRGHKKVIIAIARMMLTAIYNMLSNGESLNKLLYEETQNKPAYILTPE